MKKLFLTLIFICLTSLHAQAIMPGLLQIWGSGSTAAVKTLDDTYNESNNNSNDNMWLCNNEPSAYQSFTSGGGTLDSAKVWLKKLSTPTGTLNALIYAHTGLYGTSSKPTGAALATSDNFDLSTPTTSYAEVEFTFSGAERISLSSINYILAITLTGGSTTCSSVMGIVASDTSEPGHDGNGGWYTGGDWVAKIGHDLVFYLYVYR